MYVYYYRPQNITYYTHILLYTFIFYVIYLREKTILVKHTHTCSYGKKNEWKINELTQWYFYDVAHIRKCEWICEQVKKLEEINSSCCNNDDDDDKVSFMNIHFFQETSFVWSSYKFMNLRKIDYIYNLLVTFFLYINETKYAWTCVVCMRIREVSLHLFCDNTQTDQTKGIGVWYWACVNLTPIFVCVSVCYVLYMKKCVWKNMCEVCEKV